MSVEKKKLIPKCPSCESEKFSNGINCDDCGFNSEAFFLEESGIPVGLIWHSKEIDSLLEKYCGGTAKAKNKTLVQKKSKITAKIPVLPPQDKTILILSQEAKSINLGGKHACEVSRMPYV